MHKLSVARKVTVFKVYFSMLMDKFHLYLFADLILFL